MSRKDCAGPSTVYTQIGLYVGVLLWYGKQTAYDIKCQMTHFQFYRKLAGNYSFVRGLAKSASKASRGLAYLPD
jgi:hypothetical protein